MKKVKTSNHRLHKKQLNIKILKINKNDALILATFRRQTSRKNEKSRSEQKFLRKLRKSKFAMDNLKLRMVLFWDWCL